MENESKYNYTPLSEPVPITEQRWPDNVTPVVSISCITYNHENYIRDAIEGFLMQKTTFPVEILIHDDASTDETAAIVREYEKRHPSLFNCFYQPENTYTKPNKRELRKPFRDARRGKYIAVCEGDDYWTDPLKLQKQVDYMEQHPKTSVCTHAANILDTSSGRFTGTIKPSLKSRFFSAEEVIEGGGGLFSTNSMLYKSELIVNRPYYFDLAPAGDYVLMIHLSLAGNVYYFKDLMSVYRKGNAASWTARISTDSKYLVDHYIKSNIMLDEVNKYSEYKYNDSITNAIRKNNFYNLIRLGNIRKASQGEFKHYFNTYFSSLNYRGKAKLLLGKYSPKIYQCYLKTRKKFL